MTAQWKTASMADFLPAGTAPIISTIDSVIGVVAIPLEIIAEALDLAKEFLLAFSPIDFTDVLRSLVEEYEAAFRLSGLYLLPMWDYPVRQLDAVEDHGPSQRYGKLNTTGTKFSNYVDDISRSFYDLRDNNVPRYQKECSLFSIVLAAGDISTIGVTAEEDNTAGTAFTGMSDAGLAGLAVRERKWRYAWRKIRDAIELSPANLIKKRMDRTVRAQDKFSLLMQEELDSLPIPGVDEGDPYFLKTAGVITYAQVEATLAYIEQLSKPSEYPDWTKTALDDIIPPFTELLDTVFKGILSALLDGESTKTQIIKLIESMQDRVKYLQKFLDQIEQILDQIDYLLNATGFSVILVNSSSGIDNLVRLFRAANDPYEGERMFFSGMTLCTGGLSVIPFRLLFGPIAA